ncbi:putative 2-aminoethylphosphonate ABC transporter ATP-binding protein [Nodosilinea nodulosa]|uniref:putative 2-aminoethylphosphonate ABC transporter ATP-binding protein n=1 Tax=Nodosilinea nodulosa TaxID=416001 RepID=UPI00036C04AD|nr:putative 2-aminoethylphosphonate ABC transporter ATP-binding protein [Nodosilinea nodulosa]
MTFSEPSAVPNLGETTPLVPPIAPAREVEVDGHPGPGLGHRTLTEPYLRIENVHKIFGSFVALKDIYLNVYPGEFVCLLGPSGCGKTTLLRIISGLEQQTQGRVIQGGKDVSKLPPSMRDFGIVFQSYALFPNLTATQNIAYGLENQKLPKGQIATRVKELLDLVGLEGMGHKYPSQLSGGQQQRVALARALALSPGLLLLDEPLSALDAQVRVRLRAEIAELQRRLGITTVMVTHDQAEALAMADRIVVMDKGYIAQVGTPSSIYQHPSSPFVANFIGVMNFLDGVVEAADTVRCGNILLHAPSNEVPVGQAVSIAIRPEDMRVADIATDAPNRVEADVVSREFLGAGYRLDLTLSGNARQPITLEISANRARNLNVEALEALSIQLPPEMIRVFPKE